MVMIGSTTPTSFILLLRYLEHSDLPVVPMSDSSHSAASAYDCVCKRLFGVPAPQGFDSAMTFLSNAGFLFWTSSDEVSSSVRQEMEWIDKNRTERFFSDRSSFVFIRPDAMLAFFRCIFETSVRTSRLLDPLVPTSAEETKKLLALQDREWEILSQTDIDLARNEHKFTVALLYGLWASHDRVFFSADLCM